MSDEVQARPVSIQNYLGALVAIAVAFTTAVVNWGALQAKTATLEQMMNASTTRIDRILDSLLDHIEKPAHSVAMERLRQLDESVHGLQDRITILERGHARYPTVVPQEWRQGEDS